MKERSWTAIASLTALAPAVAAAVPARHRQGGRQQGDDVVGHPGDLGPVEGTAVGGGALGVDADTAAWMIERTLLGVPHYVMTRFNVDPERAAADGSAFDRPEIARVADDVVALLAAALGVPRADGDADGDGGRDCARGSRGARAVRGAGQGRRDRIRGGGDRA